MAKDTSKPNKKSPATMRERNEAAQESKNKPARIRKVAESASKPVSKIGHTLTKEFHVLPQKDAPGFFSKSRSAAPSYVVNSLNELKHVTWPGRKQTWKLVFAVYVFAISLGITIALVDFGLEKLFKQIIL